MYNLLFMCLGPILGKYKDNMMNIDSKRIDIDKPAF